MTTEQQRNMLEAAAKACGYGELIFRNGADDDGYDNGVWKYTWRRDESGKLLPWNPITNGLDTAEMCAKLEIDTVWAEEHVVCHVGSEMLYEAIELYEDHDNSRLRAWMFAATMCAAKTQGYEE